MEASAVISDMNFPGRRHAPRHFLVLGKKEISLRVRTHNSDTRQYRALSHYEHFNFPDVYISAHGFVYLPII